MESVKIVELKKDIVGANDNRAQTLRSELTERGVFYVNVMSSPGSGKTTLLVSLIGELKGRCKIAVMEADIDGDVDAYTIRSAGAEAVQLHTGGMCHLDAGMSRMGLESLNGGADLVFLENVGNLVCPAEFDTGAHLKLVLLSVPEGDDKPLKYSLMFGVADIVAVTKKDALPYFDFDVDKFKSDVKRINPEAKIVFTSAKTGEGVKELAELILTARREYESHRG